MARTVIGLFDGTARANQAVRSLENAGFSRSEINLATDTDSSLMGSLTTAGVPGDEARFYTEAVRRGHALVSVTTDDDRSAKAADVMEKHVNLDIDRKSEEFGTPLGASSAQTRTPRPAAKPSSGTPGRKAGEIREPIVEEELHVGKREVRGGSARIYSRITEKPVSEHVHLHEEHIDIEKRPANRPATEADLRKGEDLVITEHSEEPVVSKTARVTGEVIAKKEERDRDVTIRDTVRRKDVEVEKNPDIRKKRP